MGNYITSSDASMWRLELMKSESQSNICSQLQRGVLHRLWLSSRLLQNACAVGKLRFKLHGAPEGSDDENPEA